MKHIVTIDSVFKVAFSEAEIQGANDAQLEALTSVKALIDRADEDTFSPFKRAELDVNIDDADRVQIKIIEAGTDGRVIANGTWCHITIHADGSTFMTTSQNPDDLYQL